MNHRRKNEAIKHVTDSEIQTNNLLRELQITDIPINPIDIAENLYFEVYISHASGDGTSDVFAKVHSKSRTGHSANVKSKGFKRFTVGTN